MRERHVILRGSVRGTRDIFRGPLAAPSAEAEPIAATSVDVAEVETNEIPALAQGADVVATAPVMPMKLIAPVAPVAGAAGGPAIVEGMAWGIRAVAANTSPFTGDGIVVAVLDTGIDASHPAFTGVQLVEKDFTGTGNGDTHGHGTHCAGTIFGHDVENTRIGVARGVKKALIGKVIGGNGGSSDQIARAIQWAVDNGANVISMSLGIDFPGFVDFLIKKKGFPPALATTRALEGYRANIQLFERLASLIRAEGNFGQPTIIVAAAGNESDRDHNPDFEIAVSPPAVSEGIVSVAAVGQGNTGLVVAGFSNTGANVSGPGVDVVSARRGGGLTGMSGTSMATPHVAGVATLWAEKIRTTGVLNVLQLTARLVGSASAQPFQAPVDHMDIGAGLVMAPQ